MIGAAISIPQPSGVVSTWATLVDIRWQPGKSADVQIGFFVDEPSYNAGDSPLCKQYFALDITQINPMGNIPQQIFNQLTAVGAPLEGAQLTS